MLKFKTERVVDISDWDDLVIKIYNRPYSFQQQDGCKSRGTFDLTVPCHGNDYENDTVPEIVNHPDIGVSFSAWLQRDPKQLLTGVGDGSDYELILWWERNFYPDIQMVANDLHLKGLLNAGEYMINID